MSQWLTLSFEWFEYKFVIAEWERKRAILSTISHSSHHCHCCFCYNYSDNNQKKSTMQKISLLEHLNASYLWTLTTRRNFPHERTRTLATVTHVRLQFVFGVVYSNDSTLGSDKWRPKTHPNSHIHTNQIQIQIFEWSNALKSIEFWWQHVRR